VKTVGRLSTLLATGVLGGLGLAALATPAQASTVIGVSYEHANYGGATLTHYVGTTGFVCTGTTSDVDASSSSMPSGWNDVVSSFRVYSGCWGKYYENSGFGGASVGYQGDTSYVGSAMNDRTSSIRWS
jgi:hypothetical protein